MSMNFVDDLVDRKINHFGFVSYFASMYSKCDRDRQAIIFREVNKSVFIHRFSKEITTKTLISWYSSVQSKTCNKIIMTNQQQQFVHINLILYIFIYLFVWTVHWNWDDEYWISSQITAWDWSRKRKCNAKSFIQRKKKKKRTKGPQEDRIIVKPKTLNTEKKAQL